MRIPRRIHRERVPAKKYGGLTGYQISAFIEVIDRNNIAKARKDIARLVANDEFWNVINAIAGYRNLVAQHENEIYKVLDKRTINQKPKPKKKGVKK